MRTITAAIVCLLTLPAICAVATEHRTLEINGVTASFILLNPNLRARDALNVRFSLRNETDRPVAFSLLALGVQIDIYTARGEHVLLKQGAPIFEMAAEEIPLKPHQTFVRTDKIKFSILYDLAPGDYYLIFRYDLRLLPDDVAPAYKKKLHSEAWVNWDSKKYWFHIRR
jgi:hypothetical protein